MSTAYPDGRRIGCHSIRRSQVAGLAEAGRGRRGDAPGCRPLGSGGASPLTAESVESAIEEGIVGENPMVIQAISLAEDPSHGSVVVRERDGQKILAANQVSAFFSNYKVAIIM